MPNEFIFPTRVYVDDTDAGGVVYHATYLKFLEHARTESLRALGIEQAAIANNGTILVVASVNIRYLSAAMLDDMLDVAVVPTKVARTFVEFDQTITRAGMLLCKASIKVACVHKETLKIAPLAATTKAALDCWLTQLR